MSTEQGNQPTIFLVEEDDDTRPLLRRNLQKQGYQVIVALDEEDALQRLDGGHVRADLVLIDLVGKPPDEVLQRGRSIRQHGEYDDRMPLVVMAEKYGPELEGTDVNVSGNDWITYPEDSEQLHNLLARLLVKSTT